MNTNLLIDQLSVAVLASIVALALIQKLKPSFPAKLVVLFSALISFIVGFLFAYYYRKYDLIACSVVGLYTLIGADGLYKSFADKLKSYTEQTYIPPTNDSNSVG